ncbi:PEP/pyruvate-binding domain-containing protein [Desulfovibrio gilichinskyi]|uniref:Pyruvate phosphate dikinase, PEP/pyruvate binding domain n=1 Tax=Desulfovibrio gilichinskyi TaxID=1519643 RepID=A0A1X7ES66_9BACT|nr:PEP/pyruvate-binding domain-containing protein [Desulfovibrio gilichinskyi]SMF39292.1 Pyruvate phosphate dikinase, PEP/pyruvate binding domain [Desulfovibrio gilichinskyi]
MENKSMFTDDKGRKFSLYYDLMQVKVREILLISSPYDAWVMEEDSKLSERIVSEYRGLNLSRPPRLTWVSNIDEALEILGQYSFDLVIIMPHLSNMDCFDMGLRIKDKVPGISVAMLSHRQVDVDEGDALGGVDIQFVWSGDAELLVAMVKNLEDLLNVEHDTKAVGIRVIIVVEDSPRYLASFLPILYKELVRQTQALLEEGLNSEHRLLTMRARPKILTAQNYEEALKLIKKYGPYILGVISDVRFPRDGKLNGSAGVDLLKDIKAHREDIPLLLASNEPANKSRAEDIPAYFVDKNSPDLMSEVRRFVTEHLGFGDFIFRDLDGNEIARASSLYSLEKILRNIPQDIFLRHCEKNDFSRWFYARTEIRLANKLRPLKDKDFPTIEAHRQFMLSLIAARRTRRQQGVIVSFNPKDFDPQTEFLKIGSGSLGGKARGLAFICSMLNRNPWMHEKHSDIVISTPKTLTIGTSGFDDFMEMNNLSYLASADVEDEQVTQIFSDAFFPGWIEAQLWAYLTEVKYPLSVRSSSLLEDAQYQAYAGLYSTYMIPNDHPDLENRLAQLVEAIKLVWASTYYKAPKSFSLRVNQRTDEEKMAVIIQHVAGQQYGDYFFPAISGVGQSYNYYPFGKMKPEDGVATIAMGIGKSVVDGEQCIRFSPRYPKILPQCPTLAASLKNAQTRFYGLKMNRGEDLNIHDDANLERLNIADFEDIAPVQMLASTYLPEEGRIRDTAAVPGPKVILFAPVLKHKSIPLASVLKDVLLIAEKGMGGPVEVEFCINMYDDGRKPEFNLLQLRPMSARADLNQVYITDEDLKNAVCISSHALGNAEKNDIEDILIVRPDTFDVAKTREIAIEISKMNGKLVGQNRRYILSGPGRWGSADHWLGIPVEWPDISGVSAIIETSTETLKVEPSQGSHFFHNITTLGINYLMVSDKEDNFMDWEWFAKQPIVEEGEFVSHFRVPAPILLKVDGRNSQGVILPANGSCDYCLINE